MPNRIYTHDEAMRIVEMFDWLLCENEVFIAGPQDDDPDPDDCIGLYGSAYDHALFYVEDRLIELLDKHDGNTEVICDVFSGSV